MPAKAKPVPVPDAEPAPATASTDANPLFGPLELGDVVDIACLSRATCEKLPSEAEIERGCTAEQARPLLIEGSRLLRFMAGEAGQPEPEEVQAALVRFVQVDAMLTIVGQATAQSCVGQAQSEKKECQKNCQKRFCGCFWNSFLAKSNCFVQIGGIPGVG